MRAKKRLITFVVILVLLGGAYFAVDALAPKDDKTPIPLADKIGTPDEETEFVTVDPSTITGISYTSEGLQHSFKLVNREWKYEGIDEFPLYQNYVNNMRNTVSSIKYTRKFTDDAEIAEFADLSNPTCRIIVSYEDGNTDEYRLGALNTTTSTYYFGKSGDDAIYMVKRDAFKPFEKSIYDLVVSETLPKITSESFCALKVHTPENDIVFTPAEEGEFYTDSIKWKSVENGVTKPADNINILSFANDIMGIVLRTCVGYTDFDDTLMAKYGLDNPSASYTISSTGQPDFVLNIGNDSGNDTIYVNIGGSKFIYESTKTFAENLRGKDSVYFLPPCVCSIKISDVKKMTLNYNGETHVLINSDGKYTVDGKEVSDIAVTNFMISLTSITAASSIPDGFETVEEPYLTIDFELSLEKYPNMLLKYTPYDINYHLVSFDGMQNILVTRRDVSSVIGAFKVLLDL